MAIAPTAVTTLPAGSYRTAVSRNVHPLPPPSMGKQVRPPATSTEPSARRVIVCSSRAMSIAVVAVNSDVAGSNRSADASDTGFPGAPIEPPAIRTLPVVSRTAR